MHPMLNIAVRAARSAGQIITRSLRHSDEIEVKTKGAADFVTNIDHQAETAIIRALRKAYPKHSILSEESGLSEGEESDFLWIVDPLDGTSNFIRGIPHYCISIALKVRGKVEQAVVFDPILDELFTASRGQGTQLNGYRVRTRATKKLGEALIISNLPSRHKHHAEWIFPLQKDLFQECQDLRHTGSGALALAYVAAGRMDAAILVGQCIWDTAAGDLLVREAGGFTADINGNHDFDTSGNVLATSPRLAKPLLQSLQKHLPESLKRKK